MADLKIYWKENPKIILAFMLLLAGITYAALDSLIRMEYRWSTSEELGYAYMIPFIVGYFIWQAGGKLKQTEFRFSILGYASLILGLFFILLGVLSATHSISQYGYVLSLVSIFYMFMGWQAFKIIAAPLLLLFLAVPLPNFVLNNLSAELQLISSELGVWVIRLFGISVYLEGNVIDLGKYQLQVVEACSGLRYLFPLISLSVIAAFIYKAALWKRAVIVLSSIPITVFMNSFRIGVIGVLVEYYGIEQAEGFLHDFEGWFIFMACVSILLLEMWLLVSIGKNKQKLSEVFALDMPERIAAGTASKVRFISWKYAILPVPVLVASIAIGLVNEREVITPDREQFITFPMSIGTWEGRRDTIENRYLAELKLDDYIIADYQNNSGALVNLYLAYYDSQRSGSAAHSPRSCIPGGGWRIKSFNKKEIKNAHINGAPLTVNRLLIQKGDYGQLVYYWFQQRGRIITNEYAVKWYLFLDSLTKNRTDGALVRLTTPVEPGENLADADQRLVSFLQKVKPLLPEYIPE